MVTLARMNDRALHADSADQAADLPLPDAPPASALSPLDLLRLQLSLERLARAAEATEHAATKHALSVKHHEDRVRDQNALAAELRATYALTDAARIDPATGAITRG